MRYRIVMVGTNRYASEYRSWWWPFWEATHYNTKSTVAAVQADIENDRIARRRPELVRYDH